MARRNESILDILMVLPWWVSVIVSALAYIALAIVLPSMEFQSPLFKGFQSGLPNLAPIIALVLLVPAPISAFSSWRKRKQLDTQKSIDTIRDLSWKQFEELVAEGYRRQGYQIIENNRGGADGGVDIRLKKDGALHLIQCKNWKSQKIGVGVVRELYGVMAAENAYTASVVCSGIFTQEAKNFAAGKKIDLVDGLQLKAMISQVQRVQPSNTILPRTAAPFSLSCPQCGNDLVRRRARKGKNAGNEFYGCSTFPKCRYTRNI
jgi:restriction system protein